MDNGDVLIIGIHITVDSYMLYLCHTRDKTTGRRCPCSGKHNLHSFICCLNYWLLRVRDGLNWRRLPEVGWLMKSVHVSCPFWGYVQCRHSPMCSRRWTLCSCVFAQCGTLKQIRCSNRVITSRQHDSFAHL